MAEQLPGITPEPIGRDELLNSIIYPRVKQGKSFRLDGQAGIGKTTLLHWAYRCNQGITKVYFSCNETRKNILLRIATNLQIENVEKLTVDKLQRAILASDKRCSLFIDNIEVIKPQIITLLRSLPDWPKFYAGKDNKVKEDLKPVIWGVKKIKVDRLDKQTSLKLAREVVRQTGATVDVKEVADSCKGVPGRVWASCRGEMLRTDESVVSEEINFMPFAVAVGVAALVIMRYTGRAAGQSDMYLIGCMGMGAAMILRFFATK
jgi:hypothetical protein